jgi:electron transport complex protein RnfC
VSVAVDAQRPLARRLRGDRTVSVERLDNVYPQADPSILVYSVTKRRLRPGRLPTLQGVLLTDAVAAVAIGALVRRGEPMRQVPLCFRDRAGNGQMVIAPVGMTLGDAIRRAGFDRLPHLRQGALLSERVATREQAIGSGELVFHALADAPPVTADACVRCGWCLDVCPTRVSPVALLDARQQGNHLDLADAAGLHACVECGLCSFVCPSRLDLLTAIRQLKSAAS